MVHPSSTGSFRGTLVGLFGCQSCNFRKYLGLTPTHLIEDSTRTLGFGLASSLPNKVRDLLLDPKVAFFKGLNHDLCVVLILEKVSPLPAMLVLDNSRDTM